LPPCEVCSCKPLYYEVELVDAIKPAMFTLLRLYFQLPAKGNNLVPWFNIVLRGAGRHAINVTAGAFVGPWEADVCYAVPHKYDRSSPSIAGRARTHAHDHLSLAYFPGYWRIQIICLRGHSRDGTGSSRVTGQCVSQLVCRYLLTDKQQIALVVPSSWLGHGDLYTRCYYIDVHG